MTWDVTVLGAGPAGSVVAREIARQNRRVLLVDRATFPRPKVCGCCLNGAAIRTLEQLGLTRVLANGVSFRAARLAAGRHTAQIALPHGVAISRKVLDARLVEEAERAGVVFHPGTLLKPADALATSGVLVLATGLNAEAVPLPGSRIGAGVMVAAEAAPRFYEAGTIFMATARRGYVGLVRVEAGQLDVGAAFDPGFVKAAGGLGPAAETILGEAGWPVPTGLADLPWKGTPALTRRRARLAATRLFVVGDAAGYVEPFTGEGMSWALASAVALAPMAAREWDPGLIHAWEVRNHRLLARRQLGCRILARALRSPLLTRIAIRALAVFPVLARPVVAAMNRTRPLTHVAPV